MLDPIKGLPTAVRTKEDALQAAQELVQNAWAARGAIVAIDRNVAGGAERMRKLMRVLDMRSGAALGAIAAYFRSGLLDAQAYNLLSAEVRRILTP